MKTLNIQKSYLSITSPGVHLVPGDDELARRICRECNVFASDLKRQMPEKFGSFASLPLPDVNGSLIELQYAFDVLHADGIALETNHHGKYLGHRDFDPIFEELNRRKAVVFIHPTSPCMSTSDGLGCQHALPLPQYPVPMFEFMFDTCRCVINLFLTGTVSRFPSIRYIIPHAGGALPSVVQRFSAVAGLIPNFGTDVSITPDYVRARLKDRFWFDTAGPTFPDQIRSLLQYVGPDRICYGSDFPYSPFAAAQAMDQVMTNEAPGVFTSEPERQAVCNGNAKRLLGDKSS